MQPSVRFMPIPRERVPFIWGWLAERCNIPNLFARLMRGNAVAFYVGNDAALIMGKGVALDNGASAIWIEALGGKVGNGPKANADLARRVILAAEEIAADSDCTEIRVECGNGRNVKTFLLPRFGFHKAQLPTGPCMIKVIANG
jgi:hypothetical protein